MNLQYSLRLALASLSRSKLRTWLTVIGIVIGVTAVVLIVSVGNGLQASVQSQLGSLGADIVTITPGFNRAAAFGGGFRQPGGQGGTGGGFGGAGGGTTQQNITKKDLQAVLLTPNIRIATGIISGRAGLKFGDEASSVSVRGVDPLVWKQFSTSTIGTGRDLQAGDSNVVVIGSRVARQQFRQQITANSVVIIENKTFRVVGIFAESGSFGGDDNSVIMPIAYSRQVLAGFLPDQFSAIYAKVSDTLALDATLVELDSRLSLSRHVTERDKDFTVTAAQSIRESVASVTASISIFLGGIALISLLVGAIGIANTMFMAVLERTRQIGVLRALGATRSEISRLFLLEAGMLGFAGGFIGVFLSFALAIALSGVSILPTPPGGRSSAGIMLLTPELVIFAVLFSGIVGTLAGYFPARQAASLKPVEALRYDG